MKKLIKTICNLLFLIKKPETAEETKMRVRREMRKETRRLMGNLTQKDE